jgi:hypothetical protein
MRHDIERVHDAIESLRGLGRDGDWDPRGVDHGDFGLVRALAEDWDPTKNGAKVTFEIAPNREWGICQVVAISSCMPRDHVRLVEIYDTQYVAYAWPLADWNRGPYNTLRVVGPCTSSLFPIMLTLDVMRPTTIDFVFVVDKTIESFYKPETP